MSAEKKISADLKLLDENPVENMDACPVDCAEPEWAKFFNPMKSNWYFIIRFDDRHPIYGGGVYIGNFTHQHDYQASPLYHLLTPSGRFHVEGTKNILYDWDEKYNVRDILIAFRDCMLNETRYTDEIQSIEQRKQFAKESIEFNKTMYPEAYEYFEARRAKLQQKKEAGCMQCQIL